MSKQKSDKNGHERLALGKDRELDDPTALAECPTLYDVLRPRWKDGKCTRMGGSLSLRVVGGFYVGRLSCPTEQVTATICLTTLATLTADLERAVQSNSIVWLPDYESQKKARREASM